MAVQGQWNVLGVNIPDFRFTETLGIGSPNPNFYSNIGPQSGLTGSQSNPVYNSSLNQTNQTPYIPGVTASGQPKGSSASNPVQSNPVQNNPAQQAPQQPQGPSLDQLINDVYNPTTNYLNQAQSTLQSNYGSTQGDINAQYQTSRDSLEGERTRGAQEIATQEQKAGGAREDALDSATRLFQELQLGGQQRFGRASGIGQAFSELTNRELMQNQGDIQKQYSSALQQVGTMKQDLEQRFTSALKDLETQKNTALNDARRGYENKLLEIQRLKSSAESEKAAARLDALQQLRNQVFSINMQSLQFNQQLAAQRQSGEQQVNAFAQNLASTLQNTGGAVDAFTGGLNMNPQTAYAPGATQSGSAPVAYTGRIDDELTGSVSPLGSRRNDLYA